MNVEVIPFKTSKKLKDIKTHLLEDLKTIVDNSNYNQPVNDMEYALRVVYYIYSRQFELNVTDTSELYDDDRIFSQAEIVIYRKNFLFLQQSDVEQLHSQILTIINEWEEVHKETKRRQMEYLENGEWSF